MRFGMKRNCCKGRRKAWNLVFIPRQRQRVEEKRQRKEYPIITSLRVSTLKIKVLITLLIS